MEIVYRNLTRIKRTKFVKMYWDDVDGVVVMLIDNNRVNIPISKVFQLQRGFLTATQRYYRRGQIGRLKGVTNKLKEIIKRLRVRIKKSS